MVTAEVKKCPAKYAMGAGPGVTAKCSKDDSARTVTIHQNFTSHELTGNENGEMIALRSLWRAVLNQAIMDGRSNSIKSEAKRERANARHWLTTMSEDLREVMENAGVEPLYIQLRMRQTPIEEIQWRKPAGMGWRVQQRLMLQAAGGHAPAVGHL